MAAVALVCMPWHVVRAPSIQLGILHALLRAHGISCASHSLYLQFADFVRRAGPGNGELLTLDEYFGLGDRWFLTGAGDFAFALPPVRRPDREADRRFLQHLRRARLPSRLLRRLPRLREQVPLFLGAAADEILAGDPQVVGFTTTFGQTLPSLALAAELKRRRPELCIVFGGAACEGGMGEALHRAQPCVDVVVRGEGERVFPAVAAAVLAGAPIPELPGLCLRTGGGSRAIPEAHGTFVALDESPAPDYAEYFARLAALSLEELVQPVLPLEGSRGCWWGARSHCTFCGLNGQTMAHRSKSPQRLVDEAVTLARRHRVLDFTVVDNILDQGFFHSVLPALRDLPHDLRFFWQTKANLSREQVRLLRDAGVRWIRPGIESLSTPVLQGMRKGVTALQNVRLLKWCAEYGIHVAWNIIHGMPGETEADHERMMELVPQLVHLSPPALVPLTLDRWSPLHEQAAHHGLRVRGAPAHHRDLFGLEPATLEAMAWTFAFEHEPGREPAAGRALAALRAGVGRWRLEREQNHGALMWRRGPSFVIIDDRRTTYGRRRFLLEGIEAQVFLACDAGARPAAIAAACAAQEHRAVRIDEVRELLRAFRAEGLVCEEGDRWLGLAVAAEVAAGEDAPRAAATVRPGADPCNVPRTARDRSAVRAARTRTDGRMRSGAAARPAPPQRPAP